MAQPLPQPSTTAPLLFAELFDDTRLTHDLREGAIWDAAHTRLCLAPSDMLTGICRGLRVRAGKEWRSVLHQCGVAWGKRVAERLDRECQDTLKKRLGGLSMDAYLRFITRYFSFCGWGSLEMDLSLTRRGFVQARLRDSIFADVAGRQITGASGSEDSSSHNLVEGGFADPMVEGLLSAMLSSLSGHDLGCVQTACTSRGAEESRFLVSARERIANISIRARAGMSHEEIMSLL